MEEDDTQDLPPGAVALQRSVFDWLKDDIHGPKLHQTITAEEVAKIHGIPQKHLIRYLKREIEEAEACFSLPFTLMLVCSYAVMAVAHDDAITIRAVEDSLKEDILNNANFAYTGPYMGHKAMEDVNSFADFWSWLRIGLLPLLFQQTRTFHEGWEETSHAHIFQNLSGTIPPAERGFWLNYNRIIGGIRMSQERSDTEAACTTIAELLPLYNSECVGGLDYNLEPELGLPANQAQDTDEPSKITWFWAAVDISDTLQLAKKLEAQGWLDRLTKKVEIAIPSYNAEFGLHTLTRVNFYFSRGGHIWKKIIPMSQYSDWHDRWYYGFYDAVWILCITYILIVEIIEIQAVARSRGCGAILTDYFHLWNIIDWMSVLGGVTIIVIFLVSIDMRNAMNEALEKLGSDGYLVTGDFYRGTVKDYTEKLQDNVNYVRFMRLTVAIYPLIVIVRLFKSFSAQPKLALVTKTLASAAPDLFHFAIVFGSVFVTFTICGIVLFGREVTSFTTFSRALISCFRIMLGDIDWEELSAIGRTEASIWLWLYIIIVVLLMLNMIIAIIMDHYEDVKSSSGAAETLWEEGYQMWYRWRGKRMGTYVPLNRVLDALHDQQRREKMNKIFTGGQGKSQSGIFGTLSLMPGSADEGHTPHLSEMTGHIGRSTTENFHDEPGGDIMTLENLRLIVNKASKAKMTEVQAEQVLKGAIEDYYEQNKKGAELDEVLQLTQKVNFRVKKLVRLARKAHEERDTAPVQELEWFGKDVSAYLDAVKQERETNGRRLEELKKEKRELETRLISLGGGFVKSEIVSVNKRASILRTAHRLTQRPPPME